MTKRVFVLFYVLLSIILLSCQKEQTIGEQVTDNTILNYSLVETEMNFEWVNSSIKDISGVFKLDNNSYYLVKEKSVSLYDEEKLWERTYYYVEGLKLYSTNELLIAYYNDENLNYYIAKLNQEGRILWKNGPYVKVEYDKIKDIFLVNYSSSLSQYVKFNDDGRELFSFTKEQLYTTSTRIIENNIIVSKYDTFRETMMMECYDFNGMRKWKYDKLSYWTDSVPETLLSVVSKDGNKIFLNIINLNGEKVSTEIESAAQEIVVYGTTDKNYYYSYTVNGLLYIVKTDENLNQLWKSEAYFDYPVNLKFYKDNIYFIAKNAYTFKYNLIKMNKNNDIINEKEFQNNIFINSISDNGPVIVERFTDSLALKDRYSKIICFNNNLEIENEVVSPYPYDTIYTVENNSQSYLIVKATFSPIYNNIQSQFTAELIDKDGKLVYSFSLDYFLDILGYTTDGTFVFYCANDSEKAYIVLFNNDKYTEYQIFGEEWFSDTEGILYLRDEAGKIYEFTFSNGFHYEI